MGIKPSCQLAFSIAHTSVELLGRSLAPYTAKVRNALSWPRLGRRAVGICFLDELFEKRRWQHLKQNPNLVKQITSPYL